MFRGSMTCFMIHKSGNGRANAQSLQWGGLTWLHNPCPISKLVKSLTLCPTRAPCPMFPQSREDLDGPSGAFEHLHPLRIWHSHIMFTQCVQRAWLPSTGFRGGQNCR